MTAPAQTLIVHMHTTARCCLPLKVTRHIIRWLQKQLIRNRIFFIWHTNKGFDFASLWSLHKKKILINKKISSINWNITKVLKAFNLLFKSVSYQSRHKKGLPEEIQKTELNTNMHPLLVHNTLIPECTTRLNNAADQVPACSKIMHLSHTTQTYLRKENLK